MAAFGTKKATGDVGLQLTFPQEFIKAYKASGMGMKYAHGGVSPHPQTYIGDDFYAKDHQQKRAEAHKMVLAKVQATRDAERRMLTGHHGYGPMRPVERSQRLIGSDYGVGNGANFGLTGLAGVKKFFEPLQGGVLGSSEGQDFARSSMLKRIAQLDAIDQSKLQGPTLQAEVDQAVSFADQSKIEIETIFNQLQANVLSADQKVDVIAFDNVRRLMNLIFRYATSPDTEKTLGNDLNKYMAETYSLIENLEGFVSLGRNEPEGEAEASSAAASLAPAPKKGLKPKKAKSDTYVIVLTDILDKLLDYMEVMFKNVERPMNERKLLSQSLVKSLGIIKLASEAGDVPEKDIRKLPPSLRPFAIDAKAKGSAFTEKPVSSELSSGPSRLLSRDALEEDDRPRVAFGRQSTAGGFPDRKFADERGALLDEGVGAYNAEFRAEEGGEPATGLFGEPLGRAPPSRGTGVTAREFAASASASASAASRGEALERMRSEASRRAAEAEGAVAPAPSRAELPETSAILVELSPEHVEYDEDGVPINFDVIEFMKNVRRLNEGDKRDVYTQIIGSLGGDPNPKLKADGQMNKEIQRLAQMALQGKVIKSV